RQCHRAGRRAKREAMLIAMTASALLVLATIVVHYEVLRTTSQHLQDLPIPPRFRLIAVVVAAFAGHTVEVWFYGIAYWLIAGHFGLGGLGGQSAAGFED